LIHGTGQGDALPNRRPDIGDIFTNGDVFSTLHKNLKMLNLGHFLESLTEYQATGTEPAVVSVVIDSREVTTGSLFVAFTGDKVDGHDYVHEAFRRGACAALVERSLPGDHIMVDIRGGETAGVPAFGDTPTPFCLLVEDTMTALQTVARAWRARFSTKVIGITGSVGKTTTKELTHAVLSRRYKTLKSPGNMNNEIGLPLSLLSLQRHHQRAVLELGMYHRGEISLLCELARPHIGVVTMIGPVHLERAGSMEAIVAAKQELVEALPADGVAILNKDDDRVMGMADHTRARVFSYGLDESADLWADNIHSMGLDGIRFTLYHRGESLNLHVPLLGRHSVHTSLRAAAVALVEEMSWDEIAAGLRHFASQLRLVAVPGPKHSVVIDDTYNSSPDSAMAALNLLNDLDGRKIAVLGDMLELGFVEEESHRLVGRRVADVAHILIATGRRGRWIGEEALAVGMPADRVIIVQDVETAASTLMEIIAHKDVILVKGSLGLHMDRIVTALGRDG
jgi:UDP-N-acetylmuramoyl-tripeptide--D-alanyl-D-alanine ligase